MKKSFAILFLLASLTSFAQTQQGIVKTRGRMVNGQVVPGIRLSGATITLNFGNPLVSDNHGRFSFNVPATKSYSLVSATKRGYTLADPEYTRRSFSYSADSPFYVVLEDENQRQADINAATSKVRGALMAQLYEREEEIKALEAQINLIKKKYQDRLNQSEQMHEEKVELYASTNNNQRYEREEEIEALEAQIYLTEKEYHYRVNQLYDNQSTSEPLVREMAERYASTDYDQLDEFNRQVQMCIEDGELQGAVSLIRSKGDIEKRVAEYHEILAANNSGHEVLAKKRKKLEQNKRDLARTYEDLSRDLFNYCEICLKMFRPDSAMYYLNVRANLDTTNVSAFIDYANLCLLHDSKNVDLMFDLVCAYYKRGGLKSYGFHGLLIGLTDFKDESDFELAMMLLNKILSEYADKIDNTKMKYLYDLAPKLEALIAMEKVDRQRVSMMKEEGIQNFKPGYSGME